MKKWSIFFSWCINQIVSCICLMMFFFQHIYLSICCKPWFYVLSHMNSLHKHEDCMKYLLTRWEDVFFCNEHFLRCEKWMFFLQCRFHFEVSSFDCNLMCFGVEGINFGVQLDVCWSWTWFKKISSNLFYFYRFCTLTDWHIDRLDVIHIQRHSDIYSSTDISISVHQDQDTVY